MQGSGAQVAGQRTKQQLIFVVDATYALQDYLDKTAGFRAWITELVQIFDAKHRDKEYTLILYRGYPYGSDCAVECSDKTSDYKCFLHWFESIHYEGGGYRKHALADGLYHCLNCIVQGSENYIVVLTASEASEICTINPQVNLQIILSKLVLTCKVSLICVRKIHQLIKLWTEDVQQANMAPTQTSIPGVNAFLLGFEKKAQNHQVWAGKFAWKEQGQEKLCVAAAYCQNGVKMEWENTLHVNLMQSTPQLLANCKTVAFYFRCDSTFTASVKAIEDRVGLVDLKTSVLVLKADPHKQPNIFNGFIVQK